MTGLSNIKPTLHFKYLATRLLLILLMSPAVTPVVTLAAQGEWDGIYSLGISYGGDSLEQTSDGRELKAGGDLILGLGASYGIHETMHLQGLAGAHYASLTAANGKATLQRNFIELEMLHQVTATQRVGYGVVHEFSVKHDAILSNETFSAATGLMLDWKYRNTRFFWWGIRYANLQFENAAAQNIDASYFALMYSGEF